MDESIRILIVEDLPTDVELAQREIKRTFKSCEFQGVETREDYLAALEAFQPDVIVSDYRMPRFDGLMALKLAQKLTPFTPVIILTSAINEDTAVECMKAGAADYVIKEHIKRLGQALIRALEERHLREQRRRTEEDLRASEERFRSLYENATVGIYRTTPEGRILMANPAAVRMLGCTSFKELAERDLEKGWFEPTYPRGEFRRKLESEGVITGLESAWIRRDGAIIFVRESARVHRDEEGKVLYYDGTFEDITERKQAEEALVRLRKAVETSGEVIFMTDPEGVITFVNPAFNDVYGYSANEVVGKTTPRILKSGKEEQSQYEAFWKAILAKQTVKGELVNRSKDGRFIHIESSTNPILDDQGDIIGFLAIQRDITERKRIEKALRESEQQNRAIVNAVPDLLFRVTKDGTILDHRAPDESDLYVLPQEFRGKRIMDVLPPHVSLPATQAITKVFQLNEKVTFEYELTVRGEERFYEDRMVPLSKEEVLSVIRDITDRKRAEEALQKSEKNFRLLVESAPDAIFVQTQLCFSYLNPAALKLYGAESVEQMLGQSVMERFHPDFREKVRERIRLLNQERKSVPAIEQKHLKLDGTVLDVEVSAVPFTYQGQEGALVFVRDITERMRAEEDKAKLESQLLQAQKMESVGRLAGGVAHDFNNMLSVILGYAELIKAQLPLGDPLLIDMLEIERAAGRAKDITRQLLAFSRKQIIAPKSLNLNEVITSTEKTLARLIGEDIDLRFYPEKDLWKIKFDSSQLDQILINLAVNARDAMANGGKLTIETANVQFDEAYCRDHFDCTPGHYVMMAVSDDGTGMDKETLSHVFEPFFTTKEVGKGTGLGLATVYGIVKQNGGIINIYSEPGRGTTFKIYFPRIKEEEEIAEITEEAPVVSGGGTILLVEDDEMVRKMTTAMLRAIGYTVLVAEVPLDALALCEKRSAPIDLLLTDVVMPGMSGAELRDRIEAIKPGIKVLFMSGYTSNVIVHRGVLEEGVNFIQKPFSRNDLARKVREAIKGI